MEKSKGKFWKKFLTSAAAFVICASVGAGIAYALTSQSLNFGGDITFGANNVMATVSTASVTNNASTMTDKMQTFTITNTTSSGDLSIVLASWAGLSFEFNDDGDDVTIEFTITNNHESNKMTVALDITEGTASNATMTVSADGSTVTAGEGTDDTKTLNKTGGTTTSVTYKVVFSVEDKTKSASITGFSLAFTLADASEDA